MDDLFSYKQKFCSSFDDECFESCHFSKTKILLKLISYGIKCDGNLTNCI